MEVAARLHILLAQNSPQALVIRRGPSHQTAVIGWNRKTDHFEVGQWFKGKIYPHRCDIAPDGRHWIYFALGKKGQTYTAVAKTPYLKALDYLPQNSTWYGGGLFATNQSYWPAGGEGESGGDIRRQSGLTVLPRWDGENAGRGETFIYFSRLCRDGWQQGETLKNEDGGRTVVFTKPASAQWQLKKLFKAGHSSTQGQGVLHESHLLLHTHTGQQILLPNAQWADIDGPRLAWVQQGRVMVAGLNKNGLYGQRVLFDASPLTFAQLRAPY